MNLGKLMYFIAVLTLIWIILILSLYIVATNTTPIGFTELYFLEKPPKEISENTEYTIRFAVHNEEFKKMTYNYEVFINDQKIKDSYFTIDHDKTAQIKQKFALSSKKDDEMIKVEIILKPTNQRIHFWAK